MDFWSKFPARVKAVTGVDVARVTGRHLHPDKMKIVIVGDLAARVVVKKGSPETATVGEMLRKLGLGAPKLSSRNPFRMVWSRAMIRFNRRSVVLQVVVLVGLLGLAVVLPGCPKMKKRQEYNAMLWTAEVNENIERIYQALARHRARAKDKASYRFPSAGPTPAHIPCGKKPHASDDKLWQSAGWKELGFTIGEKFRYQYRILSAGTGPKARFTIRAHADLDCDGVYSTYDRSGTIDAKGKLKDGLLDWDKAKELE